MYEKKSATKIYNGNFNKFENFVLLLNFVIKLSGSDCLYQSILRCAEQFAHIFESWIAILKKLLNFEYLYISWYHGLTLTLPPCTATTKMNWDMFYISNRIYGTF